MGKWLGGIMRYADEFAYNKPSVLIPGKGSLGNLFFLDVPFWTVDTNYLSIYVFAFTRLQAIFSFLCLSHQRSLP